MKSFLLFLTLFVSCTALAESLILGLGDNHKIQVPAGAAVWIQNKDILKADGIGHRLSLSPRQEGKTVLKVGLKVYDVQVLHPKKLGAFNALQNFLKHRVGLKTVISDGDLLVTGTLYRMKDWHKLAQFAEEHQIQFQMRAELREELRKEARQYFKETLESSKLSPQNIIFDPQAEVRINTSELSRNKYDALFLKYGIRILADKTNLEIAPTVKIEITVAEVKKSFSQKYGLRWPQSYAASYLPKKGWSYGDLPFEANAFEENGDVKILASPNILCRSGKEAEFLAGGEFPIRLEGYKSQGVVWKRYGILLKVKPNADSSGRISLSIETEITNLDTSTAADGIPGILTNKVSSHFDITEPQTIALSGLIRNDEGNKTEGLPLISRVPILGRLFSSTEFRENRSELIIFVRPSIVTDEQSFASSNQHLNN